MCHVHGAFSLCSFLRTAFLILLGALFNVCVQAQQAPTSQSTPIVITCLSKQGERQVCKADTTAGVALVRSIGESDCLLGKNWGYDVAGVWVSNGCGGEFVVGNGKQAATSGPTPTGFVGMFEPYGQLRTHLAAYKDDSEVQDNATRVGINFETRSKVKVFAGTEWGVNLVQSETQFNLSAAGSGAFRRWRDDQSSFPGAAWLCGRRFWAVWPSRCRKTLWTALRYRQLHDGPVYVFGGQGTLSYVAGTDGGKTGTGRADRMVHYRNTALKIIDFAIQGQFRATGNETTTDGVGASFQFTFLPGVKAAARTREPIGARPSGLYTGSGRRLRLHGAGARLDWRIFEFGLVYAHQHNGDLVRIVPARSIRTDRARRVRFTRL